MTIDERSHTLVLTRLRHDEAEGGRGIASCAAFSSLIAFAVGAVIVLSYVFGCGTIALITAIVPAALALLGVGAIIGLINGRSAPRAGTRQLIGRPR
jgi:VIT1/CCC1 family predicted Fe2+/Mn2+ transporter